MSCVLVGNGSSLLDSKLGSVIDSYDNVIRFNRFRIKGFEQCCGEKMTKWYINAALKDAKYVTDVVKGMEPTDFVLFTWINTAQYRDEYCDFFKANDLNHRIDYVKPIILTEMSDYARTVYRSWSTGAIAAWVELKHTDVITLVGFDWWRNLPNHHYCDSMKFLPGVHDPYIEKGFFDMLQKEERLVFMG